MDFYRSIDRYGELPAVLDPRHGEVSYRELCCEADKVKDAVEGRHLAFTVCTNSFESVVGYLGFLRAGLPQLLVNHDLKADLLENLIAQYQPRYLWVPADRVEEIKQAEVSCVCGEYFLLSFPAHPGCEIHPDLALLLPTSGSTGSPKFVRQSFTNIICNAHSIASYLGIRQGDRPITTLPMSYTFGLSIINSHLLQGGTLILTEKSLMEGGFWDLLRSAEATTFGGVPYTYAMLKRLRFGRMDLPSLRYLTQAGGKLGRDMSEEFAHLCHQKGMRFFVMYGQTEATARMSYVPDHLSEEKAGSIGIAIPGGQFHLEDDGHRLITESDTIGELVYRGDNVTMGYACGWEDLKLGDTRNGILFTGDLAKRDRDGFYYIMGRKKRFLKLYGIRVSLDETESLLKAAGFDVVCTGRDDELVIHTTSQDAIIPIRACLSTKTNLNVRGIRIEFIETIPRNAAGKISYAALTG